jgi:nucleosome binding factor SPN SPT16 subunit
MVTHSTTTVCLQPTNSCLINVVENRFFIAPIDEIEIACFERMYSNVKEFRYDTGDERLLEFHENQFYSH